MSIERKLSNPEAPINAGFFGIRPDDINPWGCIINDVLEKAGRDERFRIVVLEDSIIAEGIWTQKEALKVAQGITYDTCGDKDFHALISDYECTGNFWDSSESFEVDPKVVKLLTESGVFEKKWESSGEKYLLIYPEGLSNDGFSVEMTHTPSPKSLGKERVTLRFF